MEFFSWLTIVLVYGLAPASKPTQGDATGKDSAQDRAAESRLKVRLADFILRLLFHKKIVADATIHGVCHDLLTAFTSALAVHQPCVCQSIRQLARTDGLGKNSKSFLVPDQVPDDADVETTWPWTDNPDPVRDDKNSGSCLLDVILSKLEPCLKFPGVNEEIDNLEYLHILLAMTVRLLQALEVATSTKSVRPVSGKITQVVCAEDTKDEEEIIYSRLPKTATTSFLESKHLETVADPPHTASSGRLSPRVTEGTEPQILKSKTFAVHHSAPSSNASATTKPPLSKEHLSMLQLATELFTECLYAAESNATLFSNLHGWQLARADRASREDRCPRGEAWNQTMVTLLRHQCAHSPSGRHGLHSSHSSLLPEPEATSSRSGGNSAHSQESSDRTSCPCGRPTSKKLWDEVDQLNTRMKSLTSKLENLAPLSLRQLHIPEESKSFFSRDVYPILFLTTLCLENEVYEMILPTVLNHVQGTENTAEQGTENTAEQGTENTAEQGTDHAQNDRAEIAGKAEPQSESPDTTCKAFDPTSRPKAERKPAFLERREHRVPDMVYIHAMHYDLYNFDEGPGLSARRAFVRHADGAITPWSESIRTTSGFQEETLEGHPDTPGILGPTPVVQTAPMDSTYHSQCPMPLLLGGPSEMSTEPSRSSSETECLLSRSSDQLEEAVREKKGMPALSSGVTSSVPQLEAGKADGQRQTRYVASGPQESHKKSSLSMQSSSIFRRIMRDITTWGVKHMTGRGGAEVSGSETTSSLSPPFGSQKRRKVQNEDIFNFEAEQDLYIQMETAFYNADCFLKHINGVLESTQGVDWSLTLDDHMFDAAQPSSLPVPDGSCGDTEQSPPSQGLSPVTGSFSLCPPTVQEFLRLVSTLRKSPDVTLSTMEQVISQAWPDAPNGVQLVVSLARERSASLLTKTLLLFREWELLPNAASQFDSHWVCLHVIMATTALIMLDEAFESEETAKLDIRKVFISAYLPCQNLERAIGERSRDNIGPNLLPARAELIECLELDSSLVRMLDSELSGISFTTRELRALALANFLSWTVDMVEKHVRTSPRLTKYCMGNLYLMTKKTRYRTQLGHALGRHPAVAEWCVAVLRNISIRRILVVEEAWCTVDCLFQIRHVFSDRSQGFTKVLAATDAVDVMNETLGQYKIIKSLREVNLLKWKTVMGSALRLLFNMAQVPHAWSTSQIQQTAKVLQNLLAAKDRTVSFTAFLTLAFVLDTEERQLLEGKRGAMFVVLKLRKAAATKDLTSDGFSALQLLTVLSRLTSSASLRTEMLRGGVEDVITELLSLGDHVVAEAAAGLQRAWPAEACVDAASSPIPL